MKKIFVPAAIMLFLAAPAIAQEHDHAANPGQAQAPARGGMMQGMGAMLGQHMMPVTVTAIDAKSGLVDATAGTMALKLHFPPPSLAGMKPGDQISVHLAFHKN